MSERDDRVIRLLAERNPVPLAEITARATEPEAEELLERILATPPSRRTVRAVLLSRRFSRRRALATAAVLALVAALGAAGLVDLPWRARGPAAIAATPGPLQFDPTGMPAATKLLGQLAQKAAAQPPAPGSGRFDYVKAQAWYLDSAVAGGRTTSALVPTLTETWTAPDGSGRMITITGHAELERIGNRETLRAVTFGGGRRETVVFGQGGTERIPLVDLGQLSTDPTALARQLTTTGDTDDWIERAEKIRDLYRQQVIPPRLQGALLRVLATTPGLVTLGRGHDRVGREVVAVGLESAAHGRPARYAFLFDPRTGAFVGYEEAMTTLLVNPQTGRDYLNVRIPAVVDYQAYLAAGHAPDTAARP